MNKAFIALLWMASALLTYWLGLEQGSDSAYPQAENQALPDDNAVIAKRMRECHKSLPRLLLFYLQ
jgi:hypothetical protein